MTHPMEPLTEHEHLEPVLVKPIPQVQTADAEFCAWQTFTFAGDGTDVSRQLLPYDQRRHKTKIYVQGNAASFVLLGKAGQVQNGQGAKIFAGGGPIEYTAAEQVWIASPNGAGAVTLVIQDERYK